MVYNILHCYKHHEVESSLQPVEPAKHYLNFLLFNASKK